MPYIADLHVHSHYSRATSKNLNLESLYQWAQIKGIQVVGTGDFTHPQWFSELNDKLVPDGSGLYQLKNPPQTPALPGLSCQSTDVRFCLTTEISSIYKFGDKVRKNHNLVFAPDLETVAKINTRLGAIGNLKADGRPILGLSSRDLLEIVLQASGRAYLIPAHVCTPWFSTLGSKAGYNSIEACFRDLTPHIFALETGLSSDPAMNWQVSALDQFTLISNSDAHSPQKLGREANIFDTDLTYDAMFAAIKTQQGFVGTIEFFPEEGKYHLDGHRACNVCIAPNVTQRHKGLCPTCGKPLTIGVLHRVAALADRPAPQQPAQAPDFEYAIPLPEIISEVNKKGPNTKNVQQDFQKIISCFGNEFTFLRQVPIEDIHKHAGPVYAEAIRRLRSRLVMPSPGYDGVFGIIKLFNPGEIAQLTGQLHCLAPTAAPVRKQKKQPLPTGQKDNPIPLPQPIPYPAPINLNDAQHAVTNAAQGATLVNAGPGTGKTQTLIHWIANCLQKSNGQPENILAITFTNKAANSLKTRLKTLLGKKSQGIHIGTFHAIGWQWLQSYDANVKTIYDAEDRHLALQLLFPEWPDALQKKIAQALALYFELGKNIGVDNLETYATAYENFLHQRQAVDLSAIMHQVLSFWKKTPATLAQARDRYQYIAVDEWQDINPLQYQFIQQLAQGKNLLAIGDTDQAIYGFRGADVRLFFNFTKNFSAKTLALTQNYRTTGTILQAAKAVIAHNTLRSGLHLQANKPVGEKIQLYAAPDTHAEARYVVQQIKKYVGGLDNLALGTHDDGLYAFCDMAVLFRKKLVGETIFTQLKKAGIPAFLGDGRALLSKPPFCVVSAILRLYVHADDTAALHTLLVHGLGWPVGAIKTLLKSLPHQGLENFAQKLPAHLPVQAQNSYQHWQQFYETLSLILQKKGVEGMIKAIYEKYLPSSPSQADIHFQKATFLALAQEAGTDVRQFLENMTLTTYTDAGRIKSQGVHLLTFHAAKGLEFPIVFIMGAEEGIKPMTRANSDLEEERRLFYVALTRAKAQVHLTHAQTRWQYGQAKATTPSRFIKTLSQHLIEKAAGPNEAKRKVNERTQLALFS